MGQSLQSSESPLESSASADVRASGGAILNATRIGRRDAPAVLLINAFGIPDAMLRALKSSLSSDRCVVSWESRGVPSERGNFSERHCGLDTQVDDALAVLEWAELDQVDVVGWCSGAQVALRLAAFHGERVRRLVLVNGTYRLPDGVVPQTDYYRDVRAVMTRVASSRSQATWWMKNLAKSGLHAPGDLGATRSSELEQLINHPYRSAEALYRYAHLVARFYDEPDHAWADEVTAPTLVLTGTQDEVAHVDSSREVAQRVCNSTLFELAGGDHYSLYDSATVLEQIARFIAAEGSA